MKFIVIGVIFFLATLAQADYQTRDTEDSKCMGTCKKSDGTGDAGESEDGYCTSKCGLMYVEQQLCACWKEGQGVECYNGQATCDTAVTDVVTGDVTQENCKDGCEALPNGPNACNAYTYISNSAAPHLGQPVCYLWKKCKEDLYDTEQESEMRCIGSDSVVSVECDKLELKHGPTAIHWNCVKENIQINPYDNLSPEGTSCTPTSSCATADPRLPGNIVCSNADDVGKWVDGESGEDAEATDIICNCPPLKVKASEATCTDSSDLTADDDGLYTLKEPRTCIILCDGIFVASLDCKKSASKETTWVATYADGPPDELEPGCTLSCDSNVCTPPPTTTPVPP